MKIFSSVKFLSVAACLAITISGCAGIGPQVLVDSRAGYGESLKNSENQQLLVNLVRLRYGEGPYFVGVSNITAQMTLATSLSGSFGYTNGLNSFSAANVLTPGAVLTQSPIISFMPLQGDKFTTQMLQSLSIDKLYLLLRSGWSAGKVLRIVVQSIGDVDNATSASRPISSYVPEHKPFESMSYFLNDLGRDHKIKMRLIEYNKSSAIEISFTNKSSADDSMKLSQMLHLSKPYTKYILSDRVLDSAPENVLEIRNRSFLGMLYYLSKGVDLTDKQYASESDVNATGFDWREVTKGIIEVHATNVQPTDNDIKVFYKNSWYSIDASDEDSKSTMVLINLIFSLQAGEIKGMEPLLTIR